MSEFIQKPENTGHPAVINDGIKKKQGSNSNGISFDHVLSEKLGKSTESQPSPSGSLPEIQSPVRVPETLPNQQILIDQLENAISLLEKYAKALETPDKPLKVAYNILNQLLEQTDSLEKNRPAKTDSVDADLLDIVTNLSTTAAVEKLKFDRGDYTT